MAADPALQALRTRPDWEGLQWEGRGTSLSVLPELKLCWDEVHALYRATGKPIADAGACFSSMAAEADLRGIPLIPIDVTYDVRSPRYEIAVRSAMKELRPYYTGLVRWPRGFECIAPDWEERSESAVARARRHMCTADFSKLPFPDQHFSLVYAHHSTPKHCAHVNVFVEEHLPELLRVTAAELRICPLARYRTLGPRGERLEEHYPIYDDHNILGRIYQIAQRAGFTFMTARSGESDRDGHEKPDLAIFRRSGLQELTVPR